MVDEVVESLASAFFVIMIANILTICNTEILNYVQ